MTKLQAAKELFVQLELAVARVELEVYQNGKSPILQAWLPGAAKALHDYEEAQDVEDFG